MAYIRFHGIRGDSQEKYHQGWCEAFECKFKFARTIYSRSSGQRRSYLRFAAMEIVKLVDSASPSLFGATCAGLPFPCVDIHFIRGRSDSGREVYYALHLEDVFIARYQLAGDNLGSPIESYHLRYASIRFDYLFWDNKGVTISRDAHGWNIKRATPIEIEITDNRHPFP